MIVLDVAYHYRRLYRDYRAESSQNLRRKGQAIAHLDAALCRLELPGHAVIDIGVEADRQLTGRGRRLHLLVRAVCARPDLVLHRLRRAPAITVTVCMCVMATAKIVVV